MRQPKKYVEYFAVWYCKANKKIHSFFPIRATNDKEAREKFKEWKKQYPAPRFVTVLCKKVTTITQLM